MHKYGHQNVLRDSKTKEEGDGPRVSIWQGEGLEIGHSVMWVYSTHSATHLETGGFFVDQDLVLFTLGTMLETSIW